MREIKFRGIDKNFNKWLYGSLQVFEDGTTTIMFTEKDDKGYTSPVISETVGQFTGLTDKKGVEIYEGDIIASYDVDEGNIINVVEFKNGCFKLVNPNYLSWNLGDYKKDYIEVIGNIHQHPHLL
jgi:uncharacterized phage protein (TIGR01671 family)